MRTGVAADRAGTNDHNLLAHAASPKLWPPRKPSPVLAVLTMPPPRALAADAGLTRVLELR